MNACQAYPPEYDNDPLCNCESAPEEHAHCPACGEAVPWDENEELPGDCEYCSLRNRIDPMENGNYLGGELDGIYVDWAIGDSAVLFSSVVDVNSTGFTDRFTRDEYVPLKDALPVALRRTYEAADWCVECGTGFDRDDLRRYIKECLDTFSLTDGVSWD